MLTATDVHHVVGLLSRATNPESVDVEMGSSVWDAASESNRDVDVTITVRNPDGTVSVFKGIEVKAHSRKLGSQIVEQLAQKLKDMPAVTHRAIVSASGFTRPAVKKANAHAVELYALKEWEAADNFDFFHHEPMPTVRTEYGWAQLTNAHINPSEPVPEEYRAAFRANPVVVFDSDKGVSPIKLREWLINVSKLAAKEAEQQFGMHLNSGVQRKPAAVTVQFVDGVWALVGNARVRIKEVRLTGIVERRTRQVPSTCRALYRLGDTQPIAGCCVSDFGDFGLVALIITENRMIELALVPISERNKQKILRRRLIKSREETLG